MIVFDGVTKRFGKRTVLEDIDLQIKPGEFISIVGPSGAGKTTIIKLILGAEKPSEGSIFMHDKDIAGFEDDDLQLHRRHIGTIFQDYKLLPQKTVFENVAFALEACDYALPQIMELVPEALEALNITHLQDQFPHELSGGESQRVALARATVHKPRLILADEPTGNLDFENAKKVLKELMKINMNGVAVLLTTHNKPLVDLIGQKVAHLQNGRLTLY
ncbi:ATP-binding cassette domain-containing protein [Candidatus Peregrinibacteria bacterium]|nr:ATP-binding cassette domain-containing protein [Candidatus Peregrinibacteria bacterium]